MFSRGRLLLLLLVVAEPMARHLLVVLPLSVAAQDDVSVFVMPSKYGEDLVLVHLIDRPLLGVTAAVLLNNLRTVMSLHTFRGVIWSNRSMTPSIVHVATAICRGGQYHGIKK